MLHFVLVLVLVLAAPGGALAADALAATDKTDNIVGRALHAIKSTCQKVKRKVQKKRQEYKALKREYHDMACRRRRTSRLAAQLAACVVAHAGQRRGTRNRTSVRRVVCGTGRGARGGRNSEARPRNSRGCQRLLA